MQQTKSSLPLTIPTWITLFLGKSTSFCPGIHGRGAPRSYSLARRLFSCPKNLSAFLKGVDSCMRFFIPGIFHQKGPTGLQIPTQIIFEYKFEFMEIFDLEGHPCTGILIYAENVFCQCRVMSKSVPGWSGV